MKHCFFLLFIYLSISGSAQSRAVKGLHLNHLFMEDGLPEGHINKFLQDKEGYMWLATFDGVVRFDGYTAKKYDLPSDDLRASPVLDICEDSCGTIWVADYYYGLYRYDRSRNIFIHCPHDDNNANSVAEGELRSITADDNGNLWLVILNRRQKQVTLDRYQIASNRFTHFPFSDKGNFITASLYQSPVYKDGYGSIWSGSENGLQKFDFGKNEFSFYLSSQDHLKQRTIEIICADPLDKNTVWLSAKNTATGKFEGLLKFNYSNHSLASFCHSNDPLSLASDTVLNIQADSKKRLWITTTGGLSLYIPSANHFLNYSPAEASVNTSAGHITKFVEDKDGNFWFTPASGTDPNISANLGLFVFNTTTKQFTNYRVTSSHGDGLRSNINRNLYMDHSGYLWWNSSAAGAEWMNSRQAKFIVHASAEAKQSVFSTDFFNSCAEAKDGSLWLATTGGLYHWFPDTDSLVPVHPDKNSRLSCPLLSVLIDDDGLIWYSGDDNSNLQGLFCYNPVSGELKNYRASKDNSPPSGSDFIHRIVQSYTGRLLLCTNEGLYTFDKKTKVFTQYKYDANGNSALRRTKQYADLVWTAFEDREHQLWLGTLGSLTRLDIATGKFTYYQKQLPHFQWIQNFYEDKQQRLWASSYNGGGLLMLDKKTNIIKRWSEKEGLLFDGPGCMLEDEEGNLWVKSVRGISIINPNTFAIRNLTDDVLTETNHLINYSFKTSKGLFIFPSEYGFVTLMPKDLVPDTATPVVHIESVAFSKPQAKQNMSDSVVVAYGKQDVSLHYDENRITFSYVGLLYQNTPQIQYRYKLDGYDNDWLYARSQRFVTYNNLSPGTYTFHVTAANSDGIWSRKEDRITITIAPPFWETWWFRLLVILTVSGLIFLAVQQYLKRQLTMQQLELARLTEAEKIRSKISMDLHDEISSGLTKISLLSQRIKARFEKDNTVDPETLDKIAGSSGEVIGNLGEIIWAINPTHDNLPSLLAYIRNYVVSFFEATDIETKVYFPDEVPSVAVSPDIKHNVFLVIKEVLNNIIKHAGATRTDLTFTFTDNVFSFTITDNGRGLPDVNHNAFGNGLINMRNRMQAIGGTLTLTSAEGKGTAVSLRGTLAQEKGKSI